MWFAREFLESMEHVGFMCICLRSIKTPEANVEFIKFSIWSPERQR